MSSVVTGGDLPLPASLLTLRVNAPCCLVYLQTLESKLTGGVYTLFLKLSLFFPSEIASFFQ